MTARKRAMNDPNAPRSSSLSEERYRLMVDCVGDIIWTVDFPESVAAVLTDAGVAAAVDFVIDHWRFSYASPAAERIFLYTPEEIARVSIRDIVPPASVARIREAMIEEFSLNVETHDARWHHILELEFLAKGGVSLWCEAATTYLRNARGIPTGILGISRDVTERRQAVAALRESESKLRGLLENLPDIVGMIDRDLVIQFVNHGLGPLKREEMLGSRAIDFITQEYQAACTRIIDQTIATGLPQSVEAQDIFGSWWSFRAVPLPKADGSVEHVMVIGTDMTQQRLAAAAVQKEQQLLRQLLDRHERERQLIAYEIHDGFTQHVAGALLQLDAFRQTAPRRAAEAWKGFDTATRLIRQAIDEARRLISGLRPPVLDELGIVNAVEYLVHECRAACGVEVEFEYNLAGRRLAPPLENAIFRIVQESLHNACRHSRSQRIGIALLRRGDRVSIEVRDWGVGFDPGAVERKRFGLQGIRERARLLGGAASIESAPNAGTRISVELPLVVADGDAAVIFDMDGVLVDTYAAHYRSWQQIAESEGLPLTEAQFAATFGRTSREIITHLWGPDRYDDAQLAELDRQKEAAFRCIIEAGFPAMPGAAALVRSLHDTGFRLAVGSSGPPENVAMVLEKLGVGDLFEAVVTGEDVTRGKPDPEVFLIAARRLGVAPADCVVIEDAPPGVAAANAGGMVSVGLASAGRRREDLAAARAVVDALDEISPQMLRRLMGREGGKE
jgi:beta-phosphoglucomutase